MIFEATKLDLRFKINLRKILQIKIFWLQLGLIDSSSADWELKISAILGRAVFKLE